jgi:hypothetical protein
MLGDSSGTRLLGRRGEDMMSERTCIRLHAAALLEWDTDGMGWRLEMDRNMDPPLGSGYTLQPTA